MLLTKRMDLSSKKHQYVEPSMKINHRIKEMDKHTHLPSQKDLGHVFRLRGTQHTEEDYHVAQKQGHIPPQLGHGLHFVPQNSEFERSVNPSRHEPSIKNEKVLKQTNFDHPIKIKHVSNNINKDQSASISKISIIPVEGFDSVSSLVCKILNHKGEPVKVNDEVISNKIILSCCPTRLYKTGYCEFKGSKLRKNKSLGSITSVIDSEQTIEITDFIQPHSEVCSCTNKHHYYSKEDIPKKPKESRSAISLHTARMINFEKNPAKVDEPVINYKPRCYRDVRNFETYLDQEKVFVINQQGNDDRSMIYTETNLEKYYDESKYKPILMETAQGCQEGSANQEKSILTRKTELKELDSDRIIQKDKKHFKMLYRVLFITNILLAVSNLNI